VAISRYSNQEHEGCGSDLIYCRLRLALTAFSTVVLPHPLYDMLLLRLLFIGLLALLVASQDDAQVCCLFPRFHSADHFFQRPSADVVSPSFDSRFHKILLACNCQLNNKHGQTPCEMRDLFPSDCGTSTAQARGDGNRKSYGML
jgi:hypothetical protein